MPLFDIKPKNLGPLTDSQWGNLKQQSAGFSQETEDVGIATDKQFSQLKNKVQPVLQELGKFSEEQFANLSLQFGRKIDIQNEPMEKQEMELPEIEPLVLNGIEYKPLPIPQEYKQAIQSSYQEHPELPKGIIEAVLMKESKMGTNKDVDNIAELKPSAIEELKRKKIAFDLSTDEGVILAAGDYLAHRMKIVKAKDAVDLYMRGYYANPSAKLDKQIFEYYLTAY